MDTTQPQQEPSPNGKNCAADEQSQRKAVSKEFAKAAKENVVGQIVSSKAIILRTLKAIKTVFAFVPVYAEVVRP